MFPEVLRGVCSSIVDMISGRTASELAELAVRADYYREKFQADSRFLKQSGVLEALEDVLKEEAFLASVTHPVKELSHTPPPIWTPDLTEFSYAKGISMRAIFFALARWNEVSFQPESFCNSAIFPDVPVQAWQEIAIFPNAKEKITIIQAKSKISLPGSIGREQLLVILRGCRDNPATLISPARDYYRGLNSTNPWYRGEEISATPKNGS